MVDFNRMYLNRLIKEFNTHMPKLQIKRSSVFDNSYDVIRLTKFKKSFKRKAYSILRFLNKSQNVKYLSFTNDDTKTPPDFVDISKYGFQYYTDEHFRAIRFSTHFSKNFANVYFYDDYIYVTNFLKENLLKVKTYNGLKKVSHAYVLIKKEYAFKSKNIEFYNGNIIVYTNTNNHFINHDYIRTLFYSSYFENGFLKFFDNKQSNIKHESMKNLTNKELEKYVIENT